jgi:hypothetical protein
MKLSHILGFGLNFLLVQGWALDVRGNSGHDSPGHGNPGHGNPGHGDPGHDKPGKRPSIKVYPKSLSHHLPVNSPARRKFCAVKGGTRDDSAAILKAFKNCNDGGHVILNSNTVYTIGKPLDLRFLKHVDWGMSSHYLL